MDAFSILMVIAVTLLVASGVIVGILKLHYRRHNAEVGKKILTSILRDGLQKWGLGRLAHEHHVRLGQTRSAIAWLHDRRYLDHTDVDAGWNAASVTRKGRRWLDSD